MGPGTIIGDKYRVEGVIGRGGMGTVVEVTHTQLGNAFALKFLHRSVVGNAAMTERFFREARATAGLKSEHVCRVFDVGSFEGLPYIVMERLDGTDLSKLLRRVGRLPVPDACDYLIQACAGIAEAHAVQIVHRDLKPGNLFLTARPDGRPLVKVLDFGIAKAPQDTDHDLTGTHTVLGSPSYMSIEQLRSSKLVDTRSDIWSLGVILYELVSGRRPFAGDGLADLAVKIAMQPTPLLPEGPRELDEVIARCLARDPAHRYPTVAELALALSPYATESERSLALSLSRGARMSRPSSQYPALSSPQPLVAYGPATTMHSAGAIEPAPPPPPRSSRARIGIISTVAVTIIVGAAIAIGVTSSGGDGGGATSSSRAADPSGPDRAAGAPAPDPSTPSKAPPPASPDPQPAPPTPPQPTAVQPTFPVEPTAGSAGSAAPSTAAGSAAPSTPPPKKPPPKRPPPWKPPPKPPVNDDFSKSRI